MSTRKSTSAVIRTFIAVKIAPTAELRRLHSRLGAWGDRFRPVALDTLHVTLKFLGDTPAEQVSGIGAVLKRIERQPADLVRLTGLGAFPNSRRPTVVWVGLTEAEFLGQIAGDLDRDLAPLGFAPESRPFHPHLTLLRIKSRPPPELLTLLAEEAQSDFGAVAIDAVAFLQSELTAGGPKYSTLGKFQMAARPS
jgi:2'-5' RNA ligase